MLWPLRARPACALCAESSCSLPEGGGQLAGFMALPLPSWATAPRRHTLLPGPPGLGLPLLVWEPGPDRSPACFPSCICNREGTGGQFLGAWVNRMALRWAPVEPPRSAVGTRVRRKEARLFVLALALLAQVNSPGGWSPRCAMRRGQSLTQNRWA